MHMEGVVSGLGGWTGCRIKVNEPTTKIAINAADMDIHGVHVTIPSQGERQAPTSLTLSLSNLDVWIALVTGSGWMQSTRCTTRIAPP